MTRARALNNLIGFKGGLMDGNTLSADDVRAIARLPSRDVLNAQLVGTIAAPLSGLVRTLNALIARRGDPAAGDRGSRSRERRGSRCEPEPRRPAPSAEASAGPSRRPSPEAAAEPETGPAAEAAEPEPEAAAEAEPEPED